MKARTRKVEKLQPFELCNVGTQSRVQVCLREADGVCESKRNTVEQMYRGTSQLQRFAIVLHKWERS